jgi:predicted DCC family thiol-disulfide oxidoreductase YuxK
MNEPSPLLIYDGDCEFCRYWVRYWQRLTGPDVRYVPYQAIAGDYPEIPPEECARSIQWIDTDGHRLSGAHAAFRLLAEIPHRRLWLWLYKHLPGFGPLAEFVYDFISRRRGAAAPVARALWGAELFPDHYALVTWVFLRLLALVYFAAFASLAAQVTGLVGSEGVLPVGDYLRHEHAASGLSALWHIPTLFWLNSSDAALQTVCWAGMVSAVALLFGIFPRASLVLCYVLYLSLVYAGQRFLEYQWDMLLLESGFLAIFLPFGSRIVVWLYRWLAFRFMLMGGIVKLASGDPSWRNLSALRYHLETQPLPSPLAWDAYQLSDSILRVATGAVLLIELLFPLLVFMPRIPRLIAAAGFLILQTGIMLAGSYNFFNLLTIVLCVFLLEDRDVRRLFAAPLAARIENRVRPASDASSAAATAMAVFVFAVCGALLWTTNTHRRPFQPFDGLLSVASTLGVVNGYGPFAVMSTERREIILEGSHDGQTWEAYEFEYKPGNPARPLAWNIPHQPRLDWQMWFAAVGDDRTRLWFPKLMDRLKAGSRPVIELLQYDPFFGHPPRYLRASLYRYTFAPPQVLATTGRVWEREWLGEFHPPD